MKKKIIRCFGERKRQSRKERKACVKNNIKLTLGTDSHHKDHMNNMKYGIYVARRGWAEKKDIINTNGLDEFEMMIK